MSGTTHRVLFTYGSHDPALGGIGEWLAPDEALNVFGYLAEDAGKVSVVMFRPAEGGGFDRKIENQHHVRQDTHVEVSPQGELAISVSDREKDWSHIATGREDMFSIPYDQVSDLVYLPIGHAVAAFSRKRDGEIQYYLNGTNMDGRFSFDQCVHDQFPQTMGTIYVLDGEASLVVHGEVVQTAKAKDLEEAKRIFYPTIEVDDREPRHVVETDEETNRRRLRVDGVAGPWFHGIDLSGFGNSEPIWGPDKTRYAYVGTLSNLEAMERLIALAKEAEAAEEKFDLTEEQLAKVQETGTLPGKMGKLQRLQERVQSSERSYVVDGLNVWNGAFRQVVGMCYLPDGRLMALVFDGKGQRIVIDGVSGPRFDKIDAIRPYARGVTYVGLKAGAFHRVDAQR